MPLPDEPRTVKPRKATARPWLPIIVADREGRSLFCEMTGEVHGWEDAPWLFRAHPASIVVVPGAAHLVAELEGFFHDDPLWQYRVSPVKRESYNPDPTRRVRRVHDTIVNYFGWKSENRKRGQWHYPVDPNLFTRANTIELCGGSAPSDLLAWGKDLREWCAANKLHASPTAGGLGGQLLRDPRFYPAARRKVPRATNARARLVLPGNHYRLYWPERTRVDATYIDMSSAHHHIASTLAFPCANTLYARGDFHTTDTTETPVSRKDMWAPAGTHRYQTMLNESYGLLRIQLNVPTILKSQFPPPYMETAGCRIVWIFTNELPMIRELHGDIEGIIAAWTSYTPEEGLNRFAAWSLSEIATMTPARKRWAKTALLAAYGNLAAKARTTEFGYRTANGGLAREYPAGPFVLKAHAHTTEIEQEIPTVNVIHRGMIEAEQRRLVLDLARSLTDAGHTVISLYADAVIVKSDRALPLLPPPWRVDAHLTRLQFTNPTTFTSVERSKLPGVSREDAGRLRRLAQFRRRI